MTIGFLEECCAEPLGLTDHIQADELITGVVFSNAPWLPKVGRVRALMGGRGLEGSNGVSYVPTRYGAVPGLLSSGTLRVDVAYVQASPSMSLGIHVGYTPEAVAAAREVVVEVNASMPTLRGAPVLDRADRVVKTDRPLLEVATRPPGDVEAAIADHVVTLVPSGAMLQVGIGALPEAIVASLSRSRRGLRLFSGMLGDSVVALDRSGALSGDEIVATTLIGTRQLFTWAAQEPRLRMAPSAEVHSVARIAALPEIVAINSALEVDLTGQVGAEEVGGRQVSGVGGQADFATGATLAAGGRSIIVLPAARIVDSLSGPVTTPRTDISFVVTEHGIAELAGRSLEERERALRGVRGER